MASPDAALIDALRRLPPDDRALLELSLGRGVPASEIATLLGLTTDEVRRRRDTLLERLAADVRSSPGTDGADRVKAALRSLDVEAWTGRANGSALPRLQAGAAEAPRAPTAWWRAGAPRLRDGLAAWWRAAPAVVLLLLPGGLTAYLGFNAGGFFPGDTAAAAVVVCLALVLRVTLADSPAAGLSALGALGVLLLGAFAVWTLLSGAWSDAPARALIEFDRALLYVLTFLLFASLPRSTRALQVMLWGFAGAATAVCLAGLASRLLPDLVSSAPTVAKERLAYPVTYWNTLGMLAALGLLACFHISAAERGPRAARVLGAAVVPALAVTLFFTFSRGAIAVLALSLVLYMVLGRPRGLASAALATIPPSVVALMVAYGAELLSTENATATAAAGQADRVALVTALAMTAAALLRLAFIPLDSRMSAVRLSAGTRRAVTLGSAAILIVLVAGTSIALDAPDRLERQYERFVEGGEIDDEGDARRRLTDPANNGRLDSWRVALEASERERLTGRGAGTYEVVWARERPVQFIVLDAHSLYLETLAELGVVGLILLVGALLVLFVGSARCIRGPDRAIYAAIFAMALAWSIRAGIDWDWEMPVITLWLFAIGGAALARARDAPPVVGSPPGLARVLTGVLVLALAITPALVYVSQAQLDRSQRSFERGDCRMAVDQALAATSTLSVRPEPFELLAYCDVRLGQPRLAVDAMEEAVERDPQAWELRYGLALVRAVAGRDPRRAARSALRLNPRAPLAQDAVRRFRTNDPQKWRRRALSARLPIID